MGAGLFALEARMEDIERLAWERAWSTLCREASASFVRRSKQLSVRASRRVRARRAASLCERWAFDPRVTGSALRTARQLDLAPRDIARILRRMAKGHASDPLSLESEGVVREGRARGAPGRA